MFRFALSVAIASILLSSAAAGEFPTFEEFPLPTGPDSREPSLYATEDGRLLMSWTEPSEDKFTVKVATLEDGTWSEPRAVTSSSDLFINWADFPSVSEFSDGTMIAHWLQISGDSTYDYDVRIGFSRDDGESWSTPLVPHRDGTKAQHGFVTLMPLEDQMVAVWLDGRAYDGDLLEAGAVAGTTQLRASLISSDGSMTADTAIDFSACSCCQTAAAIAGDALLVVYRDRNEAEIRDISLVRLQEGQWSAPVSVHDDNWEVSGCPVNGPSIAGQDDKVVVAWFTGAGDVPAVKIAFSSDAGNSFGDAFRIDRGQPVGRVDTLMMDDGSALISWVEWKELEEVLMVCWATPEGCIGSYELVANSEGNSINFPQMAATPEGIYIAWTHPLPDGSDTVRMLKSSR
jgi:hypothetical protein